MTLVLVLVVAAAVAWYLQDRQRPGADSSAAAQARHLRSPLVRLAGPVGIQTERGCQAYEWAAGAAGEEATAAHLKVLVRPPRSLTRDQDRTKGPALRPGPSCGPWPVSP